jgi:SAM-dependent methyltransferase
MDEVERLFDTMARAYDVLEPWYEHLYARVHAIVRAALPAAVPGATALDAGCGTGFQTAILEELGYRAHGVDVSAGMLAVAHARCPRAVLVRGRLEHLPYTDAAFDAVACCGSTLSFATDPAAAVSELGRVLRRGGRLVLEVEHKWSADLVWMTLSAVAGNALGYGVSLRALWRALARPPAESCVVSYPGYGPLRLFTLAELRRLLAAAGLSAVRVRGIHSATGLLPSTLLHRPQLPRRLRRPYAVLCAIDTALAALPAALTFPASLVVVATKRRASAS